METGNISLDCAVVIVVLAYQLIEMRVQQWLSGSLYLRSFFPDPSWPYTFTAQQALEVPAIHDVVSLYFVQGHNFGWALMDFRGRGFHFAPLLGFWFLWDSGVASELDVDVVPSCEDRLT